MVYNIDNYQSKAVYSFEFKNFVETIKSNKEINSDKFYVRNLPWRIVLEPSIIFEEQIKKIKDVGFRLKCDTNLFGRTSGASCSTSFNFSVLRQFKPPVVLESGDHRFGINRTVSSKVLLSWSTIDDPENSLIEGDTLTVEVCLKADAPVGINYCPPKDQLKDTLQPEGNKLLINDLSSLLESEAGADVTFVVKEETEKVEVKAHKLLLCARSSYFATMFSGSMKEAKTNIVEIQDLGLCSLETILRYIYTGELSFSEDDVSLSVCKEVVNAANKYDLPELKEYAAMALTEFVSVDNVIQLLEFVMMHKVDAAAESLRLYINKYSESAFKCYFGL